MGVFVCFAFRLFSCALTHSPVSVSHCVCVCVCGCYLSVYLSVCLCIDMCFNDLYPCMFFLCISPVSSHISIRVTARESCSVLTLFISQHSVRYLYIVSSFIVGINYAARFKVFFITAKLFVKHKQGSSAKKEVLSFFPHIVGKVHHMVIHFKTCL